VPALKQVIEESHTTINNLCEISEPDWDNFATLLEDVDERISRVWSPVAHLNGVKDSAELRAAYQEGIALLTQYHSEVGQNQALYAQYKRVKASTNFKSLTHAQQKVIDNNLLDFRLSGAELNDSDQARLREINLQLADLSNRFERNLLDATQTWTLLITDDTELAGMPQSALEMAAQLAQESAKTGWLLTLQIPSYLAVMQHAESATLRETIYRAYVQRASELSDDGAFDNAPLIDSILQSRLEKARLLGFDTYADYSLVKKMAKSSDDVMHFLNDLVQYAKPIAKQELAELSAFAKSHYEIAELNAWDVSYYSERLREQRYSFNDEQVRPYFPAPKVFDGLFAIAQRLFGISFSANHEMENWHPDVRSYNVIQSGNQQTIGQLYTDIYVRKNKRGGAWMDTCIDRRRKAGLVQTPVAFLTCNFTPPIGDDPALLTHNEVETLFHEFGHTLHHLLTEVDEMSVAGINGVAWDAVELPSQFLENWCWQEESLNLIAGHYQSGDSIPTDLLVKMRAAKNFQTGMQTLRQVEFAYFDMALHSRYLPGDPSDNVQAILNQIRDEVAVLIPPDYNRFQNSFGHIFSGGYAAGYYSYKWAEVLSADAFERFIEEGLFNANTGQAFKHAILQRGGVDDINQLFAEFRGRAPKIEPLLRQTGILQ